MTRASHERLGRHAETVAAWLLRLKGFGVLARRYKTPVGEIDLVAARGDLVVFVEVKHRPTLDRALEALPPAQRQRIVRAAEHFLARHPTPKATCRFDLIALAPLRWPRHVPNAWQAEGGARQRR
ncbi:MAG: YraN family protein [Geminicoccaceae bacterium]|nr:MAG: YraN family protein [Geminicoccaceae bacterium]